MDVGICKGTHCQVRSYYIPRTGQSWDENWEGITTSTLPDHRGLAKLELESGKAYKFRVAAINSCGRGPWSEVCVDRLNSFKFKPFLLRKKFWNQLKKPIFF